MTTYELIKQSKTNVQSLSRNKMISKLSKSQNKPTSEISTELEQLEKSGQVKCWWDGKYYYAKAIERDKVTYKKKEIIPAPKIAIKIRDHFLSSPYSQNMADIAKWYNTSERNLRGIIHSINFRGYVLPNGETFKIKIHGDNNGYKLVTTQEEKRIMLNKRYRMMLDKIEETQILIEDFAMDNQLQMDFDTMKLKIQKSIRDDL